MKIFGYNFSVTAAKRSESESRNITPGGNPSTPSGWGTHFDSIFGGSGYISRRMALEVPAVYAAVDVVSKTLAALSFAPYRRTAMGSEKAVGHPLWPLLTIEPSPNITAFNFRRDMFADACFGNAYAKIHFNGNGRPYRLERLVPEDVQVYDLPDGNFYYFVTRRGTNHNSAEVLFPHEMLHIRAMTLDNWVGVDITKQFSSSISTSVKATNYGLNYFHNNAAIDGIITFPGPVTANDREIIEKKINSKHAGVKNVGGLLVLDAAATYTKTGVSPGEAMLNETRVFQAYESCRIFGVPAHMINVLDRSTFNNIEMMDNGFVKYSLTPWAEQFEGECDVKLLTRQEKLSGSVFHRFDMSYLMRGDMKSRAEYEDKMLKNMVFTINDVRESNNLNRVEWGDTPYAQAGITRVGEDGAIEMPQGTETPPNGEKQQDNEAETEPNEQ